MWERAVSVEYAGRAGVGCVVAPGVILTARSVVEQSDGSGHEPRLVRVLNGGSEWPQAPAEVAWRRGDTALLRCRPRDLGQEFGPVRWGELTCTKPDVAPECSAVGVPQAAIRGNGTGVGERGDAYRELHGAPVRIDVVDSTSRTYGLQLDRQPPQYAQELQSPAWQGMSGAAVFCSDLLMGMVTHVPAGGGHGWLEAVPARQLLEDRGFCDIVGEASGARPRLEAADLDGLFDGLPQPVAAASYLLSPRAEVVDFVGLDAEMSALSDWCGGPQAVDVAVVQGNSGVGKTRLGVELVRRLSERRPESEYAPDGPDVPWTAGFLSETPAQQPPAYGTFRYLTRPALIVVDQADSRLEQVEALLTALSGHRAPGLRIRVLLLANSTGGWWDRLRARHEALITGTDILVDPAALYRHHTPAQVQELAELSYNRRIVALHRAGVRDDWDAYQAADERAAAAATAAAAPASAPVSAPGSGSLVPAMVVEGHRKVLSVHMEALTSVLLDSPGELTDGLPASATLVDYEMAYVRGGTGKEGLEHNDPAFLRALVALQGMAGAQDTEEAGSVIETAWRFHHRACPSPLDPGTLVKLRRAMGDLYPALDGGPYGNVGPDALTGALIDRLEEESGGAFLGQVLPSPGLSPRQRRHSLAVIARSIATRPRLAESVGLAVASHPLVLAVPATKIAEQLSGPEREIWLKSIGSAAARRKHQQRPDAAAARDAGGAAAPGAASSGEHRGRRTLVPTGSGAGGSAGNADGAHAVPGVSGGAAASVPSWAAEAARGSQTGQIPEAGQAPRAARTSRGRHAPRASEPSITDRANNASSLQLFTMITVPVVLLLASLWVFMYRG